jgi:hypothetical protein
MDPSIPAPDIVEQLTLDHVPLDFRHVDLRLIEGLAPIEPRRRKIYGYGPPVTIESWWSSYHHYPHYPFARQVPHSEPHLFAVMAWMRVQGTLPIRAFLSRALMESLAAFREVAREHEAADELDIIDAVLDRPVVRALANQRMTLPEFETALGGWIRWRTTAMDAAGQRAPLTLAWELTSALPPHSRDSRIARATYGWDVETPVRQIELTDEYGVSRERIRMLRYRIESKIRFREVPFLPAARIAYEVLRRHGGLLSIHGWLAGLPRPFQRHGPWQLRVLRELSAWGALPLVTWTEIDGTDYAIDGFHLPETLRQRVEVERAALRRRSVGFPVRIPELRTVPTSLAEQLVRHDPKWMALGNGWYRPRSLVGNPGLAEVQRMLTTLGPLRLPAVMEALGHWVVDPDIGERLTLPPEPIFRALLKAHGFAIDEEDLVSLGTLRPLRYPDSTIWRLLRIMRRHGGAISREELLPLAAARGLGTEAVDAFLARGTLVQQNDQGGYTPWGEDDRVREQVSGEEGEGAEATPGPAPASGGFFPPFVAGWVYRPEEWPGNSAQ